MAEARVPLDEATTESPEIELSNLQASIDVMAVDTNDLSPLAILRSMNSRASRSYIFCEILARRDSFIGHLHALSANKGYRF